MLFRRATLLAAVVTAAFAGLTAAPLTSAAEAGRAESPYLPGVDVSNHQGLIDWGRVAASGEADYAFVKASESTTFVDAWYARNRREAARHDVLLGAYHFARPSGGGRKARRRDARAEANHFLAVAQPAAGDLLPVLDLEVSEGLRPRPLKDWTRVWLRRVERRLGVKPMIYTSPHFWRTAMADTTRFADHGYRTLWIAHWQTASPAVPADDWEGAGWTFWQWTSCGAVPGITGCVDQNWYRGASLEPVRIPPG